MSYIVKILRQYVNDTVYLIVDDYQECASVTLDNLIMEVVDNIDNIHIVLISRILPYNIPYEAMFLKGQSVLITQQDLKLTKDEEKVIFKEKLLIYFSSYKNNSKRPAEICWSFMITIQL